MTERTTNAVDTQNQHCQCVRTVVDSLQPTCRTRGLIGESGRDAATKFTFFNSVRSLLTVPVPKLRLELDREDDSLLFVRVPHECVLDRARSCTLANLQ